MTAFLALLLAATTAASTPSRAPADSAGARPDTLATRPVVRTFPAVEVRALLPDPRSSQVSHPISDETLHQLPVSDLEDVIALQNGVVIAAEELHVRGGRSGEALMSLDGLTISEPLRNQPMDVPLLAIARGALVSG